MAGLCERCMTREARSPHDLLCDPCEAVNTEIMAFNKTIYGTFAFDANRERAERYEKAITRALAILRSGAEQRARSCDVPLETEEQLAHYAALLNAPEQAADFAAACLERALEGDK